MFRKLLPVLAACAALSPVATRAAVFERDWLTPGDGLLTYDDVNQREWLDLTETQLFRVPGGDLKQKYQAVLAETSVGGKFEGFMRPTFSEEFDALAASAGIDAPKSNPQLNEDASLALIELLGATRGKTSPFLYSEGATSIDGRTGNLIGLSLGRFGFEFAPELTRSAGVWLFRPIPEPSSLSIIVLGTAGPIVRRRRTSQ